MRQRQKPSYIFASLYIRNAKDEERRSFRDTTWGYRGIRIYFYILHIVIDFHYNSLQLCKINFQDTLIGDYYIPQGTMVIPLQWALHMNPDLWPEPEQFKPERYLDENNQIKLPGNLLPFQAGKSI